MRRYHGEPLPSSSRVAVISGDALGNYVVATPLIQMLRAKFGDGDLAYFGGERTRELWEAEPILDEAHSIFGREPSDTLKEIGSGRFDLVVNIEQGPWAKSVASILGGPGAWAVGPCLDAEGRNDLPYGDSPRGQLWNDANWVSEHLLQDYGFLPSAFIGDVFARLAYLDGPLPPYRLPVRWVEDPVPDVLIAMSASLEPKLWGEGHWLQTLQQLAESGYSVGLLGAAPCSQRRYWHGSNAEAKVVEAGLAIDLRGKWSLPEVVGAIAAARAVLTLDNGILHLAAATSTPTIGLFREGIHRLWSPPARNVITLRPPAGEAVDQIPQEQVIEILRGVLAGVPHAAGKCVS